MIRKIVDALTGYEWFIPSVAIIFGVALTISDATRLQGHGVTGVASVALDAVALVLVIAAVVNDQMHYREWRDTLDRDRARNAR